MLWLLDFRIHVSFRECVFFSRQILRTLQTLTGNHPSYPLYPWGVSLDMKAQWNRDIYIYPFSYPRFTGFISLVVVNLQDLQVSLRYRSDWWWPPDPKYPNFAIRFLRELNGFCHPLDRPRNCWKKGKNNETCVTRSLWWVHVGNPWGHDGIQVPTMHLIWAMKKGAPSCWPFIKGIKCQLHMRITSHYKHPS